MKHVILLTAICMHLSAAAQTDSTSGTPDTTTAVAKPDTNTTPIAVLPNAMPAKPKKTYPKNVVKLNIGSLLLFKNYNFVLERSLTRKISASIGFRTMPATKLSNLPVLKKGYELAGEDENTLNEDWSNLSASNKTATAEFRFYGGRKPGPRGFYLGLYGRYAKFDVDYDYLYEADLKTYRIPIKTNAKGVGGGALIGVQWLIGKRVALDWQILGGHFGKLTGTGSSATDLSGLSEEDRQNIKADLEDKLPSSGDKNSITANVSANGVKVNVDGPFMGFRSGISIGISF